MGLEFLQRVRKSSVWAGAVVALLIARYVTPIDGLAVALGVAWSLVNLSLIQLMVVALTGPDRREVPGLRRALLASVGMAGLFAVGAVLLVKLPPQSLLWGFMVPLAVIVLKAGSLLLLGTRGWKRFIGDPRRAAGILVAVGLAVWAASPLWVGAQEHGAPAASTAPESPAGEHGAATREHGTPSEHGEATSAHGEESGPQKFPNVITVVSRAFPNAEWAHFLHQFEAVIFSALVALLVILVCWLATRNAALIPRPLQNAVEYLVETLNDFILGILGPKHGPRYVPFLGTLFIYILAMNLFGLIPFMDSPTSSLNVTVALALVVFAYSQFIGIKELGIVGYLDHLAGSPRTPISWMLVPLMLPIHIMGELAKPISLSCRLFGNVFGEDMLLVAFVTLGITTLSFMHSPIGLPLQLPFLFLALLTGTLQALVFTVLSTIYFLLMLPHDDHGHEGDAQHAH
jgi:F-type H+-transporting ATPase subunit a